MIYTLQGRITIGGQLGAQAAQPGMESVTARGLARNTRLNSAWSSQ